MPTTLCHSKPPSPGLARSQGPAPPVQQQRARPSSGLPGRRRSCRDPRQPSPAPGLSLEPPHAAFYDFEGDRWHLMLEDGSATGGTQTGSRRAQGTGQGRAATSPGSLLTETRVTEEGHVHPATPMSHPLTLPFHALCPLRPTPGLTASDPPGLGGCQSTPPAPGPGHTLDWPISTGLGVSWEPLPLPRVT